MNEEKDELQKKMKDVFHFLDIAIRKNREYAVSVENIYNMMKDLSEEIKEKNK